MVAGNGIWRYVGGAESANVVYQTPVTKYGAFLAAQHAIYVNDFDNAARFSKTLENTDYAIVKNTQFMSEFLSGKLPAGVEILKKEKNTAARLIYDAYLAERGDWDEMYKRHKNDESALASPLRIWSSVATKRQKDALKFIDTLQTNDSWKAFVRGQIYAVSGDAAAAAKSFADVRTDFLNINDYLYIMSFYRHNNMNDAADDLRDDFTSRPGGMFMLGYDNIPDWSSFSGYKNALAFSLLQNVSHTQIMMYSDLAILMLRFAEIVGPGFAKDNDAINYYIGQFFYNNSGDYQKHFDKISHNSPFYSFAILRAAEKNNDISRLEREVENNPLFVPALNKLIAYHIQNGNRSRALQTVNRAIKTKNLNDVGQAFFKKSRAHIYYVFGDLDKAQSDLRAASDVLATDGEILSLQAKIWAARNREIDNAYEYAMTLVRQNPADIFAWDTLGRVVHAREGADEALDILARVGEMANSCSALFEHLGDLYMEKGNEKLARDSYIRAIELSDDGLIVVPNVRKKLRKIK